MKIIKPSATILESKGILKDVELAARTCYQSQDKITKDDSSAKALVSNIIKRRHYAMLEFGKNIIISLSDVDCRALFNRFRSEPLFKAINFEDITFGETIVSINPRTALEMIESLEDYGDIEETGHLLFGRLYNTLVSALPKEITGNRLLNYDKDGDYLFLSEYKGSNLGDIETVTVRFVCDRGVSHEVVRQRHCSFAQKSTRYCDEKGEVEFIEPCWVPQYFQNIGDATAFSKFKSGLTYIETLYKDLRAYGWKPEQARAILPNALMTELVVKASLQEWKHIFELRCDKAAHVQMRELMIPLQEEFKRLGKI